MWTIKILTLRWGMHDEIEVQQSWYISLSPVQTFARFIKLAMKFEPIENRDKRSQANVETCVVVWSSHNEDIVRKSIAKFLCVTKTYIGYRTSQFTAQL